MSVMFPSAIKVKFQQTSLLTRPENHENDEVKVSKNEVRTSLYIAVGPGWYSPDSITIAVNTYQ